MFDILLLALGLGFFVLAIGYTYACERLWRSMRVFGATVHSAQYAPEETTMIFDYSLAGLVSLGLLFYLTYALLRPERFWSCSAEQSREKPEGKRPWPSSDGFKFFFTAPSSSRWSNRSAGTW
jgi:K+-transporting ATPase KdpF subunit